jgi:alkylation response protein AidB-like acyl-CoA dehydrogenase
MKKVMTLAAAGMIALTAPAFAGGYSDPIVEDVVVVEEAASSLGNTGMALLGLALIAGIIIASDSDNKKPIKLP